MLVADFSRFGPLGDVVLIQKQEEYNDHRTCGRNSYTCSETSSSHCEPSLLRTQYTTVEPLIVNSPYSGHNTLQWNLSL